MDPTLTADRRPARPVRGVCAYLRRQLTYYAADSMIEDSRFEDGEEPEDLPSSD